MSDDSAGQERRRRGEEIWEQVTAAPLRQSTGPFHEAVLDFVSAEVWARPGLTRKERRLISLSCAGAAGQPRPVRAHVRAALESGDMSLDELREFVLHFAVYAGWPNASLVNATLDDVADELGMSS